MADDDNQAPHDSTIQPLVEDNDTPYSAPDDVTENMADTHQVTDSNIDRDEKYQEGTTSTSGASDPNNRPMDPDTGTDPTSQPIGQA